MARAEGNGRQWGGRFSKEDSWCRQQESQSRSLLKQRIEALEEEKSRLMRKLEEQSRKIKQLSGPVEECKKGPEADVDWLQLELGSSSSSESEEAEEKADLVERTGRWVMESDVAVRNSQEMERTRRWVMESDVAAGDSQEMEMVRLKEDLEEWKEKSLEMEKRIVRLERVIEEGKESGGGRGKKLPWLSAGGAVAALAWTAVAAAMIFLRSKEQRR